MLQEGVTSSNPVGPIGLAAVAIARQAKAVTRLFAIAGLGMALAACGGGGGSSDGGGGGGSSARGNVTVTVNDGTSPVSGASVSASSGGETKTGTTAADGTVTLSNLPTGTASVSASKTNYDNGTRSVTIAANATATVTVSLVRETGSIAATVTDTFGTPVPNASVTATLEGKTVTRRTASDGTATLVGVPTGAAPVTVTATGFSNSTPQNVAVVDNTATPVTIVLERTTQAAGGFVLSRVVGTPTNNGQTIQFRLQLLVIDQNAEAVTNLTAADMSLQNCAPDTLTTGPDCLRAVPNNDVGYTVTPSTPVGFTIIPGNAASPYAAALVMDQSNSIEVSDPTDARIFAGKGFMERLGANDRIVLSAFAETSGTNVAKIPTQPLTIYGAFTADGTSYFDDLDSLANQEGGRTPLYNSLNSMIDYVETNAPTGIPGQRKAVVLFSDGDDTVCADDKACRESAIANSASSAVDIFTIGLSDKVNFEAMAELADRSNGVFLFADTAEQLIPIYGALGKLLSRSLATYEVTWTIQAAAPNTFVTGRSILGEIVINTASNPVRLPIIVRIF
jgi:hypothetical protein